jgi:hypothetical protein
VCFYAGAGALRMKKTKIMNNENIDVYQQAQRNGSALPCPEIGVKWS